jgi:hypothetical protein
MGLLLGEAVSVSGQNATASELPSTVPSLVNYSGILTDGNGKPLTGVVGVTFALYKEEQGGASLWLETQNVQPDKTGHYSAMLGSTTSSGLPPDIFVAGEARWLGVQPQGQAEQPRVMLLSVPYAMKAGDAATVGGLPPSAFVLAAPGNISGAAGSSATANGVASPASPLPPTTSNVTTTGGTVNALPLWTTTTNIQSSAVNQTGSGSTAKIGINTAKPAATLDVSGTANIRGQFSLPATGVATASGGKNSQPMNQAASAFNSSTNAAVTQTFQWQAEAAANNTSNPSGTLNLLFGSGANKPAETGLNIANNGQITFAKGQTFPGTGTITGITTASGSGLTGGGTSGTLSLSVPSAGITNTMLQNSSVTLNTSKTGGLTTPGAMTLGNTYTIGLQLCTANQILQYSNTAWNCANAATGTVTSVGSGAGLTGGPITGSGSLSIATSGVTNAMLTNSSLSVNPGTGLKGGGLVILGGSTTLNVDMAQVPLLNSSNTFTNTQTVNGNLSATGVVTGSGFQIGSNLFDYGNLSNFNAFMGFAGNTNSSNTGIGNTAGGVDALHSNTTGNYNTASGGGALYSNTTGFDNTVSGVNALFYNTTGTYNTASGFNALLFNTTGSSNTASGYSALSLNTTGAYNTASGVAALGGNTTGTGNVADGYIALGYSTGLNNIGLGAYAGNAANNQATVGNENTYLGYLTTSGNQLGLNNATAIGANAEVDASNALVLGSIANINSCTPANNCGSTNVGIGTTAPTYLLHIGNQGGAANNNFLRVEGPSAAGTLGLSVSLGGNGSLEIDSPGHPGGRFYVLENGNVGIGCALGGCATNVLAVGVTAGNAIAAGWDTYSSRRWKTNIHTLQGALAKVEQLRGVSYDQKASGKHEVGVIAEEVGAVIPEIVSWDKNGKDANGVDYSRLTALLIEATKEQQALIDKQEERINRQQAQIKAQSAQVSLLQSKLAQLEQDTSELRRAKKAAPANAKRHKVTVAAARDSSSGSFELGSEQNSR